MEKIWLKSYPSGIPAEIDPGEFASLVDLFERSVARFRERVAYLNMGASLTYGRLEEASRQRNNFV